MASGRVVEMRFERDKNTQPRWALQALYQLWLLPCVRWEATEEFEQKSNKSDSFMFQQNNSGFSVVSRWMGAEREIRQEMMAASPGEGSRSDKIMR